MIRLQPDIAIFPGCSLNYLSQLNQSLPRLQFFIAEEKNSLQSNLSDFGSYLVYDKKVSFSDFLRQLEKYEGKSIYLSGQFDLSQLEALRTEGINLIESDEPAGAAMVGQVYTRQGKIVLLDAQMAQQHQVIEEECACPTCEQRFTRAYLHHLLMQTPLLCQRFLIQHNAHYYLQHMQLSG